MNDDWLVIPVLVFLSALFGRVLKLIWDHVFTFWEIPWLLASLIVAVGFVVYVIVDDL